MKKEKIKFIKFTFLFIILGICIFLLLNQGYLSLLQKSTISKTDYQFKNNINQTKILFFGDSHVKNGVNPNYINDSFNFAFSGESNLETYYKIKGILKSNHSNLCLFILPIDPHTFSSYRSKRIREEWYWKRYMDFKEISQQNNLSYFNLLIKSHFPIIGNGKTVIELILRKEKYSKIEKGYQFLYGNFSKIFNKSKVASNRIKPHMSNHNLLDKNIINYFLKIIKLSKNNNISIILIKYPLSKEYLVESEKYIPENYYNYIYNITKHYNVTILDYQKLFYNNSGYFRDSDHLNPTGAEIFSKRIQEDITKLNISCLN